LFLLAFSVAPGESAWLTAPFTKLTFDFDSEFRELALLGLLQFLFALSGIGIGQIGLVRILRLAIDMKVPDDDGNPMDIGVVLPVSTI
jgi:hypothetical protein